MLKGYYRRAKSIVADYRDAQRTVKEQFASSQTKKFLAQYAHLLNSTQVDNSTVLYESYWGRGVVDNPYAIFLYLLDNPSYSHLQHVWSISDLESDDPFLEQLLTRPNVRIVETGSNEYLKVLATAKYLVNNVTFPSYFVKRTEQIYINTWHGTPLKSMGYDMTNGATESANVIRNFLGADYLLSANPTMTDMYLKSFKLEGIMPGTLIEEGYPRNDLLLQHNREQVISKLQAVGVNIQSNKKIILYAPTWRKSSNNATVVNTDELLGFKHSLEHALGDDQFQILIKPHQFVYNALKNQKGYKGVLIPSTLDANEVLSITDILVSDYSSIFVDYLALGRPIIFYITDAKNYAKSRGLSFDVSKLPGPCSDCLDTIAEYIKDIDRTTKQFSSQYAAAKEAYCCHDDGHATQRIVETIFEGKQSEYKCIKSTHDKKRLLINGGLFLENGITQSFLSLLDCIDYNEWDVTAHVAAYRKDKEMMRRINNDINPHARTILRVGSLATTEAEEQRREFIGKRGMSRERYKKNFPWHAFKNEFKRSFGDAEFDYIVDFNGYSMLYTPMFIEGAALRKAIWMHNDIHSDMNKVVHGEKVNLENLRFNVSLFSEFDSLVSCGKSVMEVNRAHLATDDTYPKFTYAKNTLGKRRIQYSAEEHDVLLIDNESYYIYTDITKQEACREISYIKLPDETKTTFITMGRFSVEKNHARLIKAFKRYQEVDPDSQLYILGDGPLMEDTKKLVKKLELQEQVILTGNVGNPYAFMRRSNCFVLPSFHEGQPIVLLEARACRLPIIVANFASVTDSLVPNGQLLIDQTEDSIFEGLVAYKNGKVPIADFDIDAYNQEAYQEFLQAIE